MYLLENYVSNITKEEKIEEIINNKTVVFYKIVADLKCCGITLKQKTITLCADDYLKVKEQGYYMAW